MQVRLLRRAIAPVMCIAALAVAPAAEAQAPPPVAAEAAEIASCLCQQRALGPLQADLTARHQAYDAATAELNGIDQQLQRERGNMDVNNPDAVARFRQQLQRRDAVFRRLNGPDIGALNAAIGRYGAAVNEYNAQCANRPRNPILLSQIEATLSCPAVR